MYIEDGEGFLSYLRRFDGKGDHTIALDIEAESNLHVYGEKLCLIQIFDGVNSIIIDPLKIENSVLKIFFEDVNILKVMYAVGSDLSLLRNSADIEVKSILDLSPGVELLNYEKKDLHSVLGFELGIVLEKKRTYQKYNWTTRPLSKQAIDYALNDVIHLLTLKDVILTKLYARKLLETFLLKNLQVQHKDYTRHPEDKYRKIRGYSRLRDDKKSVFRKVFDIREKYAKLHNMPSHNVIRKTDLISVVNDPKFIENIRFTKRVRLDLIPKLLHELRRAVNEV